MNLSLTYLDLLVLFCVVVIGVAFVTVINTLIVGLRKSSLTM
jgi:hypothetical protein